MSEQPQEDREPPRLQDTTERSALPLPLPDGPQAAETAPSDPAPAPSDPAPAPEHPAPVELTAEETTPADKAAAVEAPGEPENAATPAGQSSAGDAPAVETPAAEASTPDAASDGAPASFPPPFDPFSSAEEGPRPEVLVGAAFVGGLALALLIKRLGR